MTKASEGWKIEVGYDVMTKRKHLIVSKAKSPTVTLSMGFDGGMAEGLERLLDEERKQDECSA